MQFGEWTVLQRGEKPSYWLCECSCGEKKEVYAPSLKRGLSMSCGNIIQHPREPFYDDITGRKYGLLMVIGYSTLDKKWKCLCDCGNTTVVERGNLLSGNTQSCGCIVSKEQSRVEKILQEKNVSYCKEYTPEGLRAERYRFDFVIEERVLLEFDGTQHMGQVSGFYTREKIIDLLKRDFIKNKFAIENNIPLYRIPYNRRFDITYEELFQEEYAVNRIDHYEMAEKFPELREFLQKLQEELA